MIPTMPNPLLPVVVALSGDGFDAGIRFGAAEALRDGGPLHLIHVVGLEPGASARARPSASGLSRRHARSSGTGSR